MRHRIFFLNMIEWKRNTIERGGVIELNRQNDEI